jgi:hypothetical protein
MGELFDLVRRITRRFSELEPQPVWCCERLCV